MSRQGKPELRAFTCELRAENNEDYGNYIEGRPIVYNERTNIGPYDEIIEEGALDGADLRDVALLVNHQQDMIPLARSRRNNKNSTMQLIPIEEGLDIRANLDTQNNVTAAETYSAVQRGDMSGMSFRFWIKRERWEDLESNHPTRRIIEISAVSEVSVVTYPAYQATSVEARSNTEALDKAKGALDKARKQAENAKLIENLKKARAIGG